MLKSKWSHKSIALILAVVMLVGMLPINAFAGGEGTEKPSINFVDSFETDYITTGKTEDDVTYQWIHKANDFAKNTSKVQNGKLTLDMEQVGTSLKAYTMVTLDAKDSQGTNVAAGWEDYSVEMTAKFTTGLSENNKYQYLGLIGRFSNGNGYYVYYRNNTSNLYLSYLSAYAPTTIGSSYTVDKIAPGTEFTLKMSFEGNVIKVYLNNKLVIDEDLEKLNEEDPTIPVYTAGSVGARLSREGEAEVSDFKVCNGTHTTIAWQYDQTHHWKGYACCGMQVSAKTAHDPEVCLICGVGEGSAKKFGVVYASFTDSLVVDNNLNDAAWRRKIPIFDSLKISAAWDTENLYLGTVGGALSNLKINNTPISNSTAAYEIVIPLSQLGVVVDRESTLPSFNISFTLGERDWYGTLVLDTFNYAEVAPTPSVAYGASMSNGNWTATLNSVVVDKEDSEFYHRSIYYTVLKGLASDLESPTVVEMDITVEYLPDDYKLSKTVTRIFLDGGLNICVVDDDEGNDDGKADEAMLTGLYKDGDKLYLLYWSDGQFRSIEIDEYEAKKQYHLRMEYTYSAGDGTTKDDNDTVAVKYFVNGALVLEAENVKYFNSTRTFGTSNSNIIQFLTTASVESSADAKADESTRAHVIVENLSVGHIVPLTELLPEPYIPPTITNILVQPGADESQLNFTWFSQSDAIGTITYAKASDLVEGELPANAATVTAVRTESKKAGYYGNKATITGLLPSTTYCYQITNGEDATEICYITTGDTEDDTFSFVFAGDPQIGRGYGSDATQNIECIKGDGEAWGLTLSQIMNASQFEGIDFLMSAGDQTNNYLDSSEGLELQYDAFANHDELLSLPIVTVLGNHDTYPGSVYPNHVNLPNMLTKEDGTCYGANYDRDNSLQSADYYFTYGNVLFLVLNTNTFKANDATVGDTAADLAAVQDHWAFIDRVMEETEDMDIDWTIVLYHQSPYGSSYHGNYTLGDDNVYDRTEQYAYINIRRFLVPKLYEIGADLVLSGHDHCYTRTHVLRPSTDPDGNYIDAAEITPYADGSYEYADGTTEPKFVSWTDANGNVYTDLKVEFKPVKVTDPDGIVHITGATSSGSQVNSNTYENIYTVASARANTRHLSRIDISENELTIVTYNMGNNTTDNISEVDRFTIVQTGNKEAAKAVADKIAAIGEVKLESKAAIEAAREAYEALTAEQKALVDNYAILTAAEAKLKQLQDAADKAAADAAAAKAVADKIAAIGEVKLESKAAIEAAREAYEDLTAEQKALVENYATLTAAEAKLKQLQEAADKAAADAAAAKAVADKIAAIGEVKLESKAAIEAAREAYEDLTAEQKALVENYAILTAAEAKLKQLQEAADKAAADAAAAKAVADKIAAIGEVKLESKAAIEAARAAYEALTAEQKALVENYATLTAAEAKLKQLQEAADKAAADAAAAKAVADKIAAIGEVKLESKAAIEAAREAYEDLTAEQKALVENYAILTAAEAKLKQLQEAADKAAADAAAAKAVADKIAAIGEVKLESKAAIEAARAAYEALTAEQKALVENYATLTAAEAKLKQLQEAADKAAADAAAAKAVADKIAAIGEVKLESKAAIEAAREAYEDLTAEQKALVENYATLTAAEAKLKQLQDAADKAAADAAAAKAVADKIAAIGEVKLESKAAIEAAREAYEALTADQKALVENYATLTAAEAQLKALQDAADKAAADAAAAKAVADKIAAIGEVKLESKTAIEAAREAYEALTADQKALVDNYATLTAAEAKLKQLQDAANKPGSPEKPIEIPADKETVKEEAKVEAGEEQHYALDEKMAGQTITIKGEGAYAIIEGKKYEAVDGVLEVKLPSKTGKIPVVIGNAGTKAGTFSITIATPSEDNSDTGDNTAIVLFGSLMALSVLAAGVLLNPDMRKKLLK